MLRPLLLATPPLGHLICLRSIVSASIRAAFLPTRAMKRKLMGGLRSSLMPNIKVYTTAALRSAARVSSRSPCFARTHRGPARSERRKNKAQRERNRISS